MAGDVEVDDATTIMTQHDETVKHAKSGRMHGKEVNARQLVDMIIQKRAPSLRRWLSMTDHVFGDGAFCDVVAQELELGLDAGRTPGWILLGHLPDQSPDRGLDSWPTEFARPGLPAPVKPKTSIEGHDHFLAFCGQR